MRVGVFVEAVLQLTGHKLFVLYSPGRVAPTRAARAQGGL